MNLNLPGRTWEKRFPRSTENGTFDAFFCTFTMNLVCDYVGPRDLTVAKLSADAAVVCWKFPASAGAQGYRLRYWIQDGGTDDDESLPSSSSAAPLELRITDTADSSESPFGTKDLKVSCVSDSSTRIFPYSNRPL